MQRAASAFVTLFLMGLCILLAGPAFEMRAFGRSGSIDAGALPQAVVVVVAVLAILAFSSDAFDHFRGRAEGGSSTRGMTVLLIGGAVLLLLAGFLALWSRLAFPIAAAAFMTSTSLLIAPPETRNLRGYTTIVVVSVAFSLGVWLAFTYLLGVPLR
ncbi:tripartite tricarboxylate transporter TctB family protein [Pararhodobacter sp. SW119]|uniref:tripartite tricarboxylate transporter TctB family protein n=1 Tax=Pararhodobacter sp. SW119 TaxID=2780075 RepID=UPI001ADEC988|nr:tripartite tricarboxylate transporter TctB family protein [Pararhodobacter sp. SW119]